MSSRAPLAECNAAGLQSCCKLMFVSAYPLRQFRKLALVRRFEVLPAVLRTNAAKFVFREAKISPIDLLLYNDIAGEKLICFGLRQHLVIAR